MRASRALTPGPNTHTVDGATSRIVASSTAARRAPPRRVSQPWLRFAPARPTRATSLNKAWSSMPPVWTTIGRRCRCSRGPVPYADRNRRADYGTVTSRLAGDLAPGGRYSLEDKILDERTKRQIEPIATGRRRRRHRRPPPSAPCPQIRPLKNHRLVVGVQRLLRPAGLQPLTAPYLLYLFVPVLPHQYTPVSAPDVVHGWIRSGRGS